MQSKDGRSHSQRTDAVTVSVEVDATNFKTAMRWQLDSTCHRTWAAHSQAVR